MCQMCTPRIAERRLAEPAAVANKPADRRRHQRVERHLLLYFRNVRERIERRGVVRDISQGGVRFVTGERLTPKELLNLRVVSPLTGIEVKVVGRVKWVRRGGERDEAGAEFVARSRHFEMDDRRRHHRVKAAFLVHCEAGGRHVEGRVRDISQGGIRFTSDEPLAAGSRLLVRLEAAGADVVASEQRFPMQVERAVQVVGVQGSAERWDIRARFVAAADA